MNLDKLNFEQLVDLLGKTSMETRKCYWTLSRLGDGRWAVNLTSKQLQFYDNDKSQVIRKVLQHIFDNRRETVKTTYSL